MDFIEQHTDFYMKFLERLVHLKTFHNVMSPELGGYVVKYSKLLKDIEKSGQTDYYEFVSTFLPVITLPVDDNYSGVIQGLKLFSVTAFITYYLQLLFIFSKITFDNYIHDLISQIYSSKVDILKKRRAHETSKSLSYEEILSYSSYDELHRHMIEKECDDIGRKAYPKKIEYLKKIFALNVSGVKPWEKDMITLCEKRNLLVHNDGVVNKDYITITKDDDYEVGDTIIVDDPLIYSAIDIFTRVATIIDEQAKKKFFSYSLKPCEEIG